MSLLYNGATKSLCPKDGETVRFFQSKVYLHKKHTKHTIGECKIALIVGSNIDDSVGTDSGSWKGVAERGKIVLDYCAMRRNQRPIWAWIRWYFPLSTILTM